MNYFFDKKLENLANPLLREVMKEDYYRIDKSAICPFEPMQLHLDINDLILKLIDDKYDIKVTAITINESPVVPMRMNGNEKIDSVFNTKEFIKCDVDRRYAALKTRYQQKTEMMRKSKNVRLYSLYYKTDGLNFDIFQENVAKYPNQLLGKQIMSAPVSNGGYFIIKYKNYYYLLLETNGLQSAQNIQQERHLIWKKLTLNELMHYDNGSYWKLIRDYNIKID